MKQTFQIGDVVVITRNLDVTVDRERSPNWDDQGVVGEVVSIENYEDGDPNDSQRTITRSILTIQTMEEESRLLDVIDYEVNQTLVVI
jgi:hypothetical protein